MNGTYHGLCYTSCGALAGTRNMLSGRHSSPSNAWKEGLNGNVLFNNALKTFSFRLAARVLLYAPSHRQDGTYYILCCTSRGALAGIRNVFGYRPKTNKTDGVLN